MWSHNSSNFSTGYTLQQNTILLGLKAITTVIIQIHYDKTDEKLVREHILTIRWLMTAVRALWSPLKQCKLRARHSKRAWLHICKSLGPKDSSERGKDTLDRNVKSKYFCVCVSSRKWKAYQCSAGCAWQRAAAAAWRRTCWSEWRPHPPELWLKTLSEEVQWKCHIQAFVVHWKATIPLRHILILHVSSV